MASESVRLEEKMFIYRYYLPLLGCEASCVGHTTLVLPHIVTGFIANHATSVATKSRPFPNTAYRPPVRCTAHSSVK